jgi:hypothetical protein
MRSVSKALIAVAIVGMLGAAVPAAAGGTVNGTIYSWAGAYATPEEYQFVAQGCSPAGNMATGVHHAVLSLADHKGQVVTVTATATLNGPSVLALSIYSNCDPVKWFSEPLPNERTIIPGRPYSFTVGSANTAILLGTGGQTAGQTFKFTW